MQSASGLRSFRWGEHRYPPPTINDKATSAGMSHLLCALFARSKTRAEMTRAIKAAREYDRSIAVNVPAKQTKRRTLRGHRFSHVRKKKDRNAQKRLRIALELTGAPVE